MILTVFSQPLHCIATDSYQLTGE